MKRNALVAYGSSDDEEEPIVKKIKLPSLSSSLTVPAPVDSPALHQGRVRSTPHVDGQFVAHVYLCLAIDRKSSLYALLSNVLASSRKMVPALHGYWSEESKEEIEVHISLSRPVFIRAHQREELKRAVKALTHTSAPFMISFAAFAALTNDEHTRTFLTMEIGAGHRELKVLSDALTPTLQAFRQKGYYSEPRFHASIAWALLDKSCTAEVSFSEYDSDGTTDNFPCSSKHVNDLRTIPRLPPQLVPSLNEMHQERLASKAVGWYEVEDLTLKIGKDVFTWRLRG